MCIFEQAAEKIIKQRNKIKSCGDTQDERGHLDGKRSVNSSIYLFRTTVCPFSYGRNDKTVNGPFVSHSEEQNTSVDRTARHVREGCGSGMSVAMQHDDRDYLRRARR